MKIYITGIAGFLGSHLAKKLISLGHEVSGNDNPLNSKINKTPEIKYRIAEILADIIYLSFFFFLYIANILWVTRKPPKIFTAARIIAKNP